MTEVVATYPDRFAAVAASQSKNNHSAEVAEMDGAMGIWGRAAAAETAGGSIAAARSVRFGATA